MHSLKVVVAAALMLPAAGLAQSDQSEVSAKAKAWMVNNFVTVKGVAQDAPDGPILLLVSADKDLDGDGASDDGIVRIVCEGGQVRSATFRPGVDEDGQARLGGGVRRWRASRAISHKIKLANATVSGIDQRGWTPVSVSSVGEICQPAIDAVKATKSRSNIQNN